MNQGALAIEKLAIRQPQPVTIFFSTQKHSISTEKCKRTRLFSSTQKAIKDYRRHYEKHFPRGFGMIGFENFQNIPNFNMLVFVSVSKYLLTDVNTLCPTLMHLQNEHFLARCLLARSRQCQGVFWFVEIQQDALHFKFQSILVLRN